MKRMKTFLIYVLLLVGFFIFSTFAERGFIDQMYQPISGETNSTLITANGNSDFIIRIEDARATKQNGLITISITNVSGHYIEKCAAKIELFTKRGVLAATDYEELNNFQINEVRRFTVKFKGTDIASYKVTMVETAPYKDPNIVSIFGWEIDLRNVLGFDLSGLKDVFNARTIGEGITNGWNFAVNFVKRLPTWVWVISTGIVIWHLPSKFLFFL